MQRFDTKFQQVEGSAGGNHYSAVPDFIRRNQQQQGNNNPNDDANDNKKNKNNNDNKKKNNNLALDTKAISGAGGGTFLVEANTHQQQQVHNFGAPVTSLQYQSSMIAQADYTSGDYSSSSSVQSPFHPPSNNQDPQTLAALAQLLNGSPQVLSNLLASVSQTQQQQEASSQQQQQQQSHHPLRVLLVRHGEAEGNVDRTVFNRVPDHAIPLTEAGREMARRTGRAINKFFRDTFGSHEDAGHHFRMMVSPFLRTRQTAECILEGLRDGQLEDHRADQEFEKNEEAERKEQEAQERKMRGEQEEKQEEEKNEDKQEEEDLPPFWVDSIRESPFLAEQDFGAMEGTGEMAQSKYKDEVDRMRLQRNFLGTFWARAPHGESFFQVCNRLVGVISDIVTAAKTSSTTTSRQKPVRTVIVVTHGVTLRSFCSVWCHYSPEWLATSQNPPNCAVRLLCGSHDCGYIHGGWEGAGDMEKFPQGLPVSSIKIGTDAARETWGNVLTRIRDRNETLDQQQQQSEQQKKVDFEDGAIKDENSSSSLNASFTATVGGRMMPTIANSWIGPKSSSSQTSTTEFTK